MYSVYGKMNHTYNYCGAFFYDENARYEILFVQFFFVYTANLIKYKNE